MNFYALFVKNVTDYSFTISCSARFIAPLWLENVCEVIEWKNWTRFGGKVSFGTAAKRTR